MTVFLQTTYLYEFTLGANTWRYTANGVDVVDNLSRRWLASSISDDGVKQTGEASTDSLTVIAPQNIAPSQLFMYSPPSAPMGLTIYRAEVVPLAGDQFDASAPQRQVMGLRAVYAGEIAQATFPSPVQCRFTAETISATMQREGLRLGYQRQCPHSIYDINCKVVKALHAVPVTVVSISGLTVVVSGLGGPADGLYNAGLLEFVHPVKGAEALTIESHTGSNFVMFGSVEGLYVGMQATAYRGCNQTPDSCKSFGNYPNYGGFEFLPGKSPFEGLTSPIF